jgi:hypothetical protein
VQSGRCEAQNDRLLSTREERYDRWIRLRPRGGVAENHDGELLDDCPGVGQAQLARDRLTRLDLQVLGLKVYYGCHRARLSGLMTVDTGHHYRND